MNKYQTFLPRFGALLIDTFIMLPLGIFDDWFHQAEFPHLFFYVWIPLSSLVFPVYTITMHGLYGQTLGKMWFNVKVTDANEEPIKFAQAVWRDVPQLIFSAASIFIGIAALSIDAESMSLKYAYGIYAFVATIWVAADILVFFNNEKRRALHDYIAGTVVVRTNV
jgi:uncharacterized RDD family membrane protein YckC